MNGAQDSQAVDLTKRKLPREKRHLPCWPTSSVVVCYFYMLQVSPRYITLLGLFLIFFCCGGSSQTLVLCFTDGRACASEKLNSD